MQATYWTPAFALCAVVAGAGVPVAVHRARHGDGAARAATALLALALASALASRTPWVGFFGLYNWGTGWLFICALVGAWALGRALSAKAVVAVETALLAAAGINAAIAVLETMFDLSAFQLGRYGGRAAGTMGNPIHVGAFVAAALALAAPRFHASPRRWGAVVVLLGAGAQTTGSRFSLVVALGVVAWVAVRFPLRTVGVFVAAVLLGAVAGSAVVSSGGGASVTARVATSAGNGITPRIDTWTAGFEAGVRRPVLGYGPGQFRTATSPHRTIDVARAEAPDRLFVDAHNIVVEYAATVGLLGAALFLAWLGLSARAASGPLLVFALAVLANHLVEPQSVRTTPVALLALGAACVTSRAPLAPSRAVRRAAAALAAVGAVAGGWLLVGDFHLDQARLDFDRSHARAALRMLPRWSEPATIRARISLFEGRVQRDPAETAVGIEWLYRAAERDPSDPALWNGVAEWELSRNHLDAARSAFATALRWNPTSTRALNGLANVAHERGAERTAIGLLRRSLAVDPDQEGVRERLDATRGGP